MAKRKNQNVWEDIVQPKLNEIAEWTADGMTMSAIAKQLGIATSTLWNYAQKKEELKKALAYEAAATQNVEGSLYQKCIGYDHYFYEQVKCKETYFDDKGNKCSREVLKKKKSCIYIPPDVNAQKFWLLNHASDRYKSEQPEINITNELLEQSDKVLVKVRDLANQIKQQKEEEDNNGD